MIVSYPVSVDVAICSAAVQSENPMAALWKKNFFFKNSSSFCSWRRYLHSVVPPASNVPTTVLEDGNITSDHILENLDKSNANMSVLEPSRLEDVSYIGPPLDFRSFNFAAFANNSVVIQKLLDLGVDFYKIEQGRKLPSYLLQLDFEKDVIPYIT